jgi:hypothetical protein
VPPPRFDLDVTVRGDKEVLRALRDLPDNAEREIKDGSERLARQLATIIRAAGRTDTRQSARASRTVRALRRVDPLVVAGPHPMLFGSEFGILRRTGWYARRRYARSPERQYRRHRGSASYWFFRTYERNTDTIREAHADMVDAVIRRWSA